MNTTRRLMGLGATCLAVLGIAVVTTPAAQATPNRRVCVYSSWAASDPFPVFAMNYKADGGCPKNGNTATTVAGAGGQVVDTGKLTCERFSTNVLKVDQHDFCPTMKVDTIYKITKNQAGSQDPNSLSFSDKGHY